MSKERHKNYLLSMGPKLTSIDDDFIRGRYMGLGGSDAAIVMGLSPYKTPLVLYREKTFMQPMQDLSGAQPVKWGHILEDPIRLEFCSLNNVSVETFTKPFICETFPWLRANIDGLLPDNEILEIKTAGAAVAYKWDIPTGQDNLAIPFEYLLQVQLYMYVLKAKRAKVAVLIGGNDYRQYQITFDRELANDIVSAMNRFWLDNVIPKVEPLAHDYDDLLLKYPVSTPATRVKATPEITVAIQQLEKAREVEKKVKAEITLVKFKIAEYVGANEIIVDDDDKRLLTFKSHERKLFNRKGFMEDHPEQAKEYFTTTHTRTMRTI